MKLWNLDTQSLKPIIMIKYSLSLSLISNNSNKLVNKQNVSLFKMSVNSLTSKKLGLGQGLGQVVKANYYMLIVTVA